MHKNVQVSQKCPAGHTTQPFPGKLQVGDGFTAPLLPKILSPKARMVEGAVSHPEFLQIVRPIPLLSRGTSLSALETPRLLAPAGMGTLT